MNLFVSSQVMHGDSWQSDVAYIGLNVSQTCCGGVGLVV